MLEDQLTTFIYDVWCDKCLANIRDLGGFTKKMVETCKQAISPLICLLIELALVLSVATASVESVYSVMDAVKTDLCNKMGDE